MSREKIEIKIHYDVACPQWNWELPVCDNLALKFK